MRDVSIRRGCEDRRRMIAGICSRMMQFKRLGVRFGYGDFSLRAEKKAGAREIPGCTGLAIRMPGPRPGLFGDLVQRRRRGLPGKLRK